MDEFEDEFAKKLFLQDDQMEKWEIVENPVGRGIINIYKILKIELRL
jgi:hypothetical protein